MSPFDHPDCWNVTDKTISTETNTSVTSFSQTSVVTPSEDSSSVSLQAPTTIPSRGFHYDVADTPIFLNVNYYFDRPIPRLSMNAALLAAEISIREQIETSQDHRLKSFHWTFIQQEWDCIIYVERNPPTSLSDPPRYLTYDLLLGTIQGLRGAVFYRNLFCAVDFQIFDKRTGYVGTGEMIPWSKNANLTALFQSIATS